MTSLNLRKIAVVTSLSVAAIVATTIETNAQGNRRNDDRKNQKIEKQQDKIDRQQDKIEAQRDKLQRERQQDRFGSNNNNNNRYRVMRNGRYYNTDNRGAELLRQAVNAGYQQGYQAGRNDKNSRRRSSWTTSNVYRSGTYGYQSYVDRSQYQYYFQQGFQKGYQDGFSSQNRYGSNGSNILGSILGSILNIQQY